MRTRSVVRDHTPEREWEEALRQARRRFQRFFANAPVGIALLDRLREGKDHFLRVVSVRFKLRGGWLGMSKFGWPRILPDLVALEA